MPVSAARSTPVAERGELGGRKLSQQQPLGDGAGAPGGPVDPAADPARFGAWVENACLAHAWNSGQRVSSWREEPFEVNGVIEGTWGAWAIEVKTGPFRATELAGLLEFNRRHPRFKPLVLGAAAGRAPAERAGVAWQDWRDYLLGGPPGTSA